MRKLMLFVAASALLPLATPTAAQPAGAAAGLVLEAVGTWERQASGVALAPGDYLEPGEAIITRTRTSGRLRLALLTTGKDQRHECTIQTPCEASYRVPSSEPPASGLWAFIASFWKSGRQFPRVFAATRSGDTWLTHAVVAAAQRITLAPAITGLPPGTYTADLEPAPDAPAARASSVSAKVEVGDTSPPTIDGVRQGLYMLTMMDARGRLVAGPVAVLVATDAPAAGALLRQAQESLATWPDTDRELRNKIVVQTLYAIAARQPAK